MYLVKIGEKNTDVEDHVRFERVADNLLMISIEIGGKSKEAFLNYWRLVKTVDIPPLEIGISSIDGTICSIVFYMELTCLKKEIKGFGIGQEKKGSVVIDTSVFKKNNDFIDIEESYNLYFNNNKLFCSFEKEAIFNQAYRNGRVMIYLVDDQVMGFAICELSQQEILEIKSIIEVSKN